MGKRLVPVLAFLAMWMPVAGFALGLGSITMNSALNQPLDADIELYDVKSGDLDNLVVRLGSQLDFDRVGAERSIFLTTIKFELTQKFDGTPFIKAISSRAVVEPFLDFVVEARWPRGRVLREFTVLVDPPTLVEEAPAPVQQATVAPQAAPQPRAKAEPVERTIDDEAFFSSSGDSAPSSVIQERAELAPVAVAEGELVYGPVKYSDTLWGIANKMRPSGITINQMMVALERQNPRAFYHSNVNEMKAGYVLRIDDREALSQLSAAAANTEIQHQTREWRARKSGKLVQQAQDPTAGQVARGASEASTEAQTSAAAGEDSASLKLVAPGSTGVTSGAGSEDVDQLRQDLLLAAEALETNRQETEDLKSRLKEMEEQFVAMQRLIMLKDTEMATLQQQMGGDAASSEPAMEPEAGDEDKTAEAMMAEEGMPALQPAPQPVPAPVAMSLLDEVIGELMDVIDDPMSILEKRLALYLVLGIIGLLLLGLLMMRRRSMRDGFEESILNVGNKDAVAESKGAPAVGESSMVSDFAMSEMSDMSGIQADAADVDPISEADVYLAYGRHQQAEDIIREALKGTPDRHELRVKMLEIHFAAKNRDAFEAQANELHEILGDESDPLWARAVTMGHQLCPGNELFGGISADTLKEDLASGVADNEEDLLDFDFDLDSTDLDDMAEAPEADVSAVGDDDIFAGMEDAESSTPAEVLEMGGLDFDIADEAGVDTAPGADQADAGLDFDVSSLDFDLDENELATDTAEKADDGLEAVDEKADIELDAGLDFDLGDSALTDVDTDEITLDTETTEPLEDTVEETGLDEGLDFDLEDEITTGDEATDEIALNLQDDDLSLKESTETDPDLDMDIGELSLGDTEAEADSEALGDDVFGELDEVGTKLDLARAYVDMGDKDGARSILNEVIEEGNEGQKNQAQELMGQID